MSTANQTATALSVNAAMGRRLLTDSLFKHTMTVGGISVIVAVSAIFFYLASVVVPLFVAPEVEPRAPYAVPGPAQPTLAYTGEEQREIGSRVGAQGSVTFFDYDSGAVLSETLLPLPPGVEVTAAAIGERRSYSQGFGLSDGRVMLVQQGFTVTYPDDKRLITPTLSYPLGEQPIALDPRGQPIRLLGVQSSEDGSTLVALSDDGRLLVSGVNVTTNPITGAQTSEQQQSEIAPVPAGVRELLIESKQRELFVLHGDRRLARYDIADKSAPRLIETVDIAPEGQRVTALAMLSGGFSLIVGTDRGELAQWFPVRTEGTNFALRRIRGFEPMPAAVTALAPEFFRKGFIAGDAQGHLGSYFATSQRLLFRDKLSERPLVALGVPPRGNGYLAQDASGQVHAAAVENHYPEVSFSALWQKVWYESYEEPDHVWQSSAANAEFEPKFSLAPLTYGTLKAATYAMAISVPLAILGAIFTAYFMSPRMRTIVKPTIEVMEALPTVVLGFLAGLWLAPLVENNLAGVLLSIVLLPASMIVAAYVWHLMPERDQGPRRARLGGGAADAGAGRRGLADLPDRPPDRGRVLRRRHAQLAEQRARHQVRAAQLAGGRHRDGIRGHADHLLDRRGRDLLGAQVADLGLAGAGRDALADADGRRAADRQPGHLLGRDDRPGARRRRDHDRADGHRQHGGDGFQHLHGIPHPVGQHRRRDAGGRRRRDALPAAVPVGAGAVRLHLLRQHARRAGAPAPARAVPDHLRPGASTCVTGSSRARPGSG
jgi:phosphate transport system permease protein